MQDMTPNAIARLVDGLFTPEEMAPRSTDEVARLPAFAGKMQECERICGTEYAAIGHALQDALVLRRLQQMTATLLLNPLWKERLAKAGITAAPRDFAAWQQLPLADKETQRDLFMDARPGMVVPISHGGFEIVASGGTSSGRPVETVYSLRELWDTYRIAGTFMGRHVVPNVLVEGAPKWVMTTLADHQMWSSGTMVGGVLQSIPGVNYIGAGPVTKDVYHHILAYPGPKLIMGISASVARLAVLGEGADEASRASLRCGMYGSGALNQGTHIELRAMYPNIQFLSYFAATQAETIGLQLTPASPYLAAVPGLHLIEVVDASGRWVADGEEGELVVTRLHAHEAPLPRFKLGDRVVRRPVIDRDGLRTQQFEFRGRSGDVIHLGDTQYSAPQAYASLCREFRNAGVFDLEAVAHEVQFFNHRKAKSLTLTAAVDDPESLAARLRSMLEPEALRRLFIESLVRSLSLFNQSEANSGYVEKTGYSFEIRLVGRASDAIVRTNVGKTPLLRDVL